MNSEFLGKRTSGISMFLGKSENIEKLYKSLKVMINLIVHMLYKSLNVMINLIVHMLPYRLFNV